MFRALLLLYPSAFRAEYGPELERVFAQRRRDASNPFSLSLLWIETLIDTLLTAARVHADMLWQDLQYTARSLRQSPGFTVTAITVAALGIGATTAAFSVTDHVLLRPLPFADSDRLTMLFEKERGYSQMEPSPANYRDWKQMSTSFEAMGAMHFDSVNLAGEGEPQRLEATALTADILPMLGVHPVLGRWFSTDDDRDGASGTVILSNALWKMRFGGDVNILGKTIRLDEAPFRIIGVMPPEFAFPSRRTQIWKPAQFGPANFEDRSDNWLNVVAKRKLGVSLERAAAEMTIIASQLARQYPKDDADVGITTITLRDQISDNARLMLKVLLAAALCVLLIACTNLANLLLARAMVRRRELAVRAAMGAGRERLIRQLMTESLTLAILGGIFGVLLAVVSIPLLAKLVPNSLPIAENPSIDFRLLGFAVLLASATGIAFGVLPALRSSSHSGSLREGSRAGVGGRRERLRGMLVVAEVALSVVLLVSSGLLLRALLRLQSTDPGFQTSNILTLRTTLPFPKYEKLEPRVSFYSRVLSQVNVLPGAKSAAYTSFVPMGDVRGGVWRIGLAGVRPEESPSASLRFVTPGFFSTLGIPLLKGRDVSETDSPTTPMIAVVSESFARSCWPGEDPIGKHFRLGPADREVVGIVGDVRQRGLERVSEPQAYLPYRQHKDGVGLFYAPKDLLIHTSGDALALLPAVREIIRSVDPSQPISNVATLGDVVAADTAARSLQVKVLGAFALIAFLLAGIGIHGVLSYAVSQRTAEIGVRIAVGARPADILSMILKEGLVLALIGIVGGTVLAYGSARTMQSLLAGVSPGDSEAFGAGVFIAFAMTIAGCLMPAMRAVRVDPIAAIRAE